MVAWIVVALLGQYFLTNNTREPYPSIIMPGFHRIGEVSSVDQVPIVELELTIADTTHTVGYAEAFDGAPPGQQRSMHSRLADLTGDEAEWEFFDATAVRLGLGARVDEVAVVRRVVGEAESTLARIERES